MFCFSLVISSFLDVEKSGSPYADIAELNNLLNSISLKNLNSLSLSISFRES